MSEPQPILEATSVTKTYSVKRLLGPPRKTRALDDVSLSVKKGEVVALIGESGSGKTTLGKVLGRLTGIDSGQVLFDGVDLFSLSAKDLRKTRKSIQMVFQNPRANLHPRMTVHEMLDESLRLHRPELDEEGRVEMSTTLLTRVGLNEHKSQRVASLSGGECRRVGLARILATRPKLIVADEPTSGLDAAIKLQIIELLKSLKEESMSYLIISHDLGLVRRIADRILVMLKGRIIEEISVRQLDTTYFLHPYTKRLFRAADLDRDRRMPPRERRAEPRGDAIPQTDQHAGCIYLQDCALAERLKLGSLCGVERPPAHTMSAEHKVWCFGSMAEHKEEWTKAALDESIDISVTDLRLE